MIKIEGDFILIRVTGYGSLAYKPVGDKVVTMDIDEAIEIIGTQKLTPVQFDSKPFELDFYYKPKQA